MFPVRALPGIRDGSCQNIHRVTASEMQLRPGENKWVCIETAIKERLEKQQLGLFLDTYIYNTRGREKPLTHFFVD